MDSVERVKKICKERKIPISRLEKDLGYSNGYVGQLRKGVFPSDRLVEISKYLGISEKYLMTGIDEDGLTEKDNRDIAKDLENLKRKLSNKEDGPASYEGTDIPEDDLDMFTGQIEIMLRRLKTINKEKYNPNKNKK